ncbi:DnaA N-terminal domain-containing protein [Paenibacillus tarimensis]
MLVIRLYPKWEQGECLPDIEVLLRLAKIFDKSVEELLLGEQRSHRVKSLDQSNLHSSDIWADVLEEIKKQLSFPSFNTWFKNTSAKYEGDSLIIYSPNNFSKEWLSTRYTSLITEALNKLTGDSKIQLKFQTDFNG